MSIQTQHYLSPLIVPDAFTRAFPGKEKSFTPKTQSKKNQGDSGILIEVLKVFWYS